MIAKSIILLFFLSIIGVSSGFGLATNSKLGTAETTSTGVEYNYGEYLFDTWLNQTWDHTTIINSNKNSENGTYSYTSEDYININGSLVLRKIEYENEYETNMSYFSNQTITGKQAYHMIFDCYNVNASYGDALQLIWFGFKEGTLEFIQEVSEYKSYEEYNMSEYIETVKTTTMYNDTDNDGVYETQIKSIVEEYNDTQSQQYNSSYDMFNSSAFENVSMYRGEQSFEMIWPFIITTQIYTTEGNQKVAWGKMIFPEFLLYNDTDGNGIYSLGKSKQEGQFSIYYSDEFQGNIFPQAMGIKNQTLTKFYKDGTNITQTYSEEGFPSDISIEKLAQNITFHEPQETTDGLSWSINYNEMPIQCSCCTNESCFSINTGEYKYASPTNFSFGFNYDVAEDHADLSQNFRIDKMTNDTFYDKVQGLGLSIPYYTYFLSSEEVVQETSHFISFPAEIINFTLGGIPTAQIDMGKIFPEKRNYTLYDYPSEGTSTEFSALGATVSQLIVSASEKNTIGAFSRAFMFKGLVLPTIENDPAFDTYIGIFTMASMNYPIWSGEKLLHDPTFTVFYDQKVDGDKMLIHGYLGIPLIATGVITVTIIFKNINRKKKEKK